MYMLWLTQTAPVLEELINAKRIAFRETFDLSAIKKLDDAGGRQNPSGYWTNLHMKYGALGDIALPTQNALRRIASLYSQCIPPMRIRELKAIPAEMIWTTNSSDDDDGHAFIRQFAAQLGIEFAADLPNPKTQLILISPEHSANLVSIWRQYLSQVSLVIVLLGTSYRHVREDLHLPAECYAPLLSTDTLTTVDENIRKKMIPER